VDNLDGIAGDEFAISLPGAIGPGSASGAFYVIDGLILLLFQIIMILIWKPQRVSMKAHLMFFPNSKLVQ